MLDYERSVRERYADAARAVEPALCCPTDYDPSLLAALPDEIVSKDYGCGDPSAYVQQGETVVDLGSGTGKVCYILSQKVGPSGFVVGVDVNDDMLALARRYQAEMTAKIGYDNVVFRRARIQDMGLDLDTLQGWLEEHPVCDVDGLRELEREQRRIRAEAPAVADGVVDVVVSNCVLNLVRPDDKQQLFRDMHRVLRDGGRCVISDIVCDEPPTERMLADPELWSGCIAGAFVEGDFLQRFEQAGFQGVEILARQAEPWRVVDGIEFRSMTVRAYKAEQGPCLERNQAVVYRGPWRAVVDDDGRRFVRGERTAVCDRTYRSVTDPDGPYAGQFDGIAPTVEVPLDTAQPFDRGAQRRRDPRVSKRASDAGSAPVGDGGCWGPTCC